MFQATRQHISGSGLTELPPVADSYAISPASPNIGEGVTISSNATDVLSGLSDVKIYPEVDPGLARETDG
jgi:hypothetical protein